MIKTEIKQTNLEGFQLASTLVSVVKGVIISYIFLIFAFMALALFYTYTKMSSSVLDISTKLVGYAGVFLSGFFASAISKNRGWLHGFIAGILHTALRLSLGLIIFKTYVPASGFASTLLVSVAISVLGGILGVNAVKNRRHKKRRK